MRAGKFNIRGFVLLVLGMSDISLLCGQESRITAQKMWEHRDQGIRVFRDRAEKGSLLEQFNLGWAYYNGAGAPQVFAEALRLFRKAADQGDERAQYYLGIMYERGQGVQKDVAEAVRWFRRAADQADAKAQFQLGLYYESGSIVTQDFVQAHMWLNLAASSPGGVEVENLKNYAQRREEVAKRMTAQQIAEAQRLAMEWRPEGATDSTAK